MLKVRDHHLFLSTGEVEGVEGEVGDELPDRPSVAIELVQDEDYGVDSAIVSLGLSWTWHTMKLPLL